MLCKVDVLYDTTSSVASDAALTVWMDRWMNGRTINL